MSDRPKMKIQLFSPASAEPPPPVQVRLAPDMGVDDAEPEPHQTTETMRPAASVEAVTADTTVVVPALPLVGWGLAWAFSVILIAQAIKRVVKAIGVKEKVTLRTWRRWLFVWPILAGCVLSMFYGQRIGDLVGLDVTLPAALFLMGPASGTAATWVYDFSRGVVLPLLPDAVILLIEKGTGITLPQETKDNAKQPLSAGSTGFVVLDSEALEEDTSSGEETPTW